MLEDGVETDAVVAMLQQHAQHESITSEAFEQVISIERQMQKPWFLLYIIYAVDFETSSSVAHTWKVMR